MNGKSLDNPKRLVFRLNDLYIYIYFQNTSLQLFLCYDIDTAQLLHLVVKISHLDSPQLSILFVLLYLQQLGVKHYHMRLVLYFSLTTGECNYQVMC